MIFLTVSRAHPHETLRVRPPSDVRSSLHSSPECLLHPDPTPSFVSSERRHPLPLPPFEGEGMGWMVGRAKMESPKSQRFRLVWYIDLRLRLETSGLGVPGLPSKGVLWGRVRSGLRLPGQERTVGSCGTLRRVSSDTRPEEVEVSGGVAPPSTATLAVGEEVNPHPESERRGWRQRRRRRRGYDESGERGEGRPTLVSLSSSSSLLSGSGDG